MPSPEVAGIPEFEGVKAPPSAPAASIQKNGVPADSSQQGGTPAVSQRKAATGLAADLGLPDSGFGSDSESVEKTPTQQKVPERPSSSAPHPAVAWLQSHWAAHGKEALQGLAEWPIVAHMIVGTAVTWILGRLQVNALLVVLVMVLYLFQVHVVYAQRLKGQQRKELRNESPVSDEETTRWVNTVLARAWPVWLERTVSLKLIPLLAPWFLTRYKPWALKRLELRNACLGYDPPILTGVRVYTVTSEGYHVEMEMNVEMVSAPDMFIEFVANVGNASWAGLGLIPWTAFATNLHLYGRIRVGLRFHKIFPFVDRISISFVSEPKVSLSINVMGMGLGKGFDAGTLPLVASYVDATLKRALKGSLVAPNKLVVEDIAELLADVVQAAKPDLGAASPGAAAAGDRPVHSMKPVAAPTQTHPLAFARVELLEAEKLMAADSNGLSDPFVRGCIGLAKFNSSIKRKTLNPKWFEDFRVPILEWQEKTVLKLLVMDYDRFSSADDLGLCEVDLAQLRDGQRHDLWIRLDKVKTGKLHIAITIEEKEEGDQVQKQEVEGDTFDGSAAVMSTQTLTKEGGQVALASVTLNPKEGIEMQSPVEEQAAPLVSAKGAQAQATVEAKGGSEKLSHRPVRLGTMSYKVAPGCVVYAWDQ